MPALPAQNGSGSGLKFVAERSVVAAFETAFLSLALAGLDQVSQTPRPQSRGFAALRAAFVSLHPELIFSLPGYRQCRELIFDARSHWFCSCTVGHACIAFDRSARAAPN